MRRLLRFFLIGPGALLTVILFGLSICWLIKSGQDRQAEEAKKHQVQRALGNVNPSDEVDPAAAQKEKILADRRLIPGSKSAPLAPPAQTAPPPTVPTQARALPQLVSFYARFKLPQSSLLIRSLSGRRNQSTGSPQAHSSPARWSIQLNLRTSILRSSPK